MVKRKRTISVLLSIVLIISVVFNIVGALKANQKRVYHVNSIFFLVKQAITYIERYFDNKEDVFNVQYAGLQLVALDELLRGNPQVFQAVGVRSFNIIGERLSVSYDTGSVIVDRRVSADGEMYLHRLMKSLSELLLKLAEDENLEKENSNLTYEQINDELNSFYSSFFEHN